MTPVRRVAVIAFARPRLAERRSASGRRAVPTAAPGPAAVLLAMALAVAPVPHALAGGAVDPFSDGTLAGWESRSFDGETDYRLEETAHGIALCARSENAASGLYYRLDGLDLRATPYLHWSWRVDDVFAGNDETTRAGDDYPARVYVVVSGGLRFWRTRSLVYVWSSRRPVGSLLANPFTDHARQITVRSGEARLGQWLDERRNVREDFRRAFGDTPDRVDAVAVMTDTDNTGGRAHACYGDLSFAAE